MYTKWRRDDGLSKSERLWKARQYLDPKSHEYIGDEDAVKTKLKGQEKTNWLALKKELEALQAYAALLLGYGEPERANAVARGELVELELKSDDDQEPQD